MTTEDVMEAIGKVVKVFGNLLHVEFEGDIRQGEIGFVELEDLHLKAEVIEIAGSIAKMQVFEDTQGICLHTRVRFTKQLLEAELGPGLIGSVFDGLQNPLHRVADISGLFLSRGVYVEALDRHKRWDFHPSVQEGAMVKAGDVLGTTQEGKFVHKIMVPFVLQGEGRVTQISPIQSYQIEETIAVVEDMNGVAHPVSMLQRWPIKNPLMLGKQVKARELMQTGCRIIDTQFPLLKGGTFCTPGPFGAGKTVLQHHLAKYSAVDLVIVSACGERAGEVVEVLKTFPNLVDPHTGDSLMKRTIIICNTSSMPVAAREASVYMGVTIGEFYRQMGLNVLLLADSTSRWAQAMREMSGRLEQIPGEEAFPAYLASTIAAFYERSGVVDLSEGQRGSLTIGGAVSPAGGNFEEPVTQATLDVVGAFLGLSRERSDARRYPAIAPLISWSKYGKDNFSSDGDDVEGWAEKSSAMAKLLQAGDEIARRMEVVGEEGVSIKDLLTYLKAELYDFAYLQQNAFDQEDAYCPLERQIALFSLMWEIAQASFHFTDANKARTFFLSLQSRIRNLNFMRFETDGYHSALDQIRSDIQDKLVGGGEHAKTI